MHATQTLRRKCGCGGACGNESQVTRSAIASNGPDRGTDDVHQPMLDRMREEGGLDPQGFPDAYLKYSCPPGQPRARPLTVDVQPVRIAQDDGSNPTAAPVTSVAASIWRRCCVNLNVLPVTTIHQTSLQTISSVGGSSSAEERQLIAAVQGPNRITVVTFRNFDSNGVINTSTRGGAGTFGFGSTQPVVFAVDIAVGEVIAHEIGHALGYLQHQARDNGTIMEGTGSATTANPLHVSAPVCRDVRTGSAATAGASASCCQRFV
jgi:hypothetical protein